MPAPAPRTGDILLAAQAALKPGTSNASILAAYQSGAVYPVRGSSAGKGPGNIGSIGWGGASPQGPTPYGAGQGSTPSTGQIVDNPFKNFFNFQFPTASTDSGPGTGTPGTTGTTGTSYGQYAPIIIVGVIVAGIGYVLFERRKK